MSESEPTTERVKAILSRISASYVAAANIEKRMTAEPDDWNPMAHRGVEESRRRIAEYDRHIQEARDLEAQLEDALEPVAGAIEALVKEGT